MAKETFVEKITALQGTLVMLNFRQQRCGIELADGSYFANIQFDDALSTDLQNTLKQGVYLLGIGQYDNASHLRRFFLHEIYRLDQVSPQALQDHFIRYQQATDTHGRLREGLLEALRGDTYPIDSLWDGIDAD